MAVHDRNSNEESPLLHRDIELPAQTSDLAVELSGPELLLALAFAWMGSFLAALGTCVVPFENDANPSQQTAL